MNKLKIVIVTDSFYPRITGVSHFVEVLLKYLKSKDIELGLIVPSVSKKQRYLKGVKFLKNESKPLFSSPEQEMTFGDYEVFKKFLGDFKPDLIHLNSYMKNSYYCLKYSLKNKIPIIITHHSDLTGFTKIWVDKNSENKKILGNKRIRELASKTVGSIGNFNLTPLFKLSDHVVGVSLDTKKRLSNIVELEKLSVIHNSCNLQTKKSTNINEIRKKYKLSKKDKYFLHVGRLSHEKRIDLIIKSFKKIEKKNLYLILASDGSIKDELKELVESLDLTKKVIFAGFIKDEDLNALYKNCICFVSASPFDTFNMSAANALYFSKPIIGPKSGGIQTFLKDCFNGFLIPINEEFVDEMSSKMKGVLNLKLNKFFSKNSKEISKEFSPKKMGDEYLELYKIIIKKGFSEKKNSKRLLLRYLGFIKTLKYSNKIGWSVKKIKSKL